MAYKVIILYRLYMPSYFLGTFTEYPFLSAIFFTYLYPTRKNTIYYKYTKAHLIYIQKQFVSI